MIQERTLKVGDILVSSWGYNMTIVNFYRVVKLVGAKSVKIEKLTSNTIRGDSWSGHSVPNLEISGQLMEKSYRELNGQSVKISSSEFARPWNGKPMFFNHLD